MSHYVYPRLSGAAAESAYSSISEAYRSGGLAAVRELSRLSHSSASPVPTGGTVATETRIAAVREAAEAATQEWIDRGIIGPREVGVFDIALGRALHRSLEITPADAAHVDTWNFLSLVVMPHLSVLRFPDMHRTRIFGMPRNSLRRAWQREEVIGDLLLGNEGTLGEDILVGMFERTALARNRTLIRAMTRALLSYDGPIARSTLARRFSKTVTWATGPFLLDTLSQNEVDELIPQYLNISILKLNEGGDLEEAEVSTAAAR